MSLNICWQMHVFQIHLLKSGGGWVCVSSGRVGAEPAELGKHFTEDAVSELSLASVSL